MLKPKTPKNPFHVIVLSTPHRKGTYGFTGYSDPYSIFFVYPKGGSNVVVKGYLNEVEAYTKKHYPDCIYRYTYWKNGISRGSWGSTRQIYFGTKEGKRNKKTIRIFDRTGNLKEIVVRRIPHRWLPIYDVAGY